jgi:hemoglobin
MQTPTLFDAIGGDAAITAAVDAFYERVLADPMLAPMFVQTEMTRQKAHQRAFLTFLLRGTGSYNGRTMRAAHAGRGITDVHFDRVAGHLADTLAALGVPEELIGQIIGGVAPLRAEIVDTPTVAVA